MKKSERLDSSLFQRMEEYRISNLALCLGGEKITTYDKNTCQATDCADTGSSDGHTLGGTKCDWSVGGC